MGVGLNLRPRRNRPRAAGFTPHTLFPDLMPRTLPALALALTLVGCSTSGSMSADAPMTSGTVDAGVMVGGAMMLPTNTLVENAVEASTLTTLVSAVQAADLAATLSGPGPFTVFAPTNAAFDKVPSATLQSLMEPSMKGDLTSILTFHVVPGRLSANDLRDGQTLTTVNGATLMVKKMNGQVMVGNAGGMATVTQANVYASNGVAHVIDTVLMP